MENFSNTARKFPEDESDNAAKKLRRPRRRSELRLVPRNSSEPTAETSSVAENSDQLLENIKAVENVSQKTEPKVTIDASTFSAEPIALADKMHLLANDNQSAEAQNSVADSIMDIEVSTDFKNQNDQETSNSLDQPVVPLTMIDTQNNDVVMAKHTRHRGARTGGKGTGGVSNSTEKGARTPSGSGSGGGNKGGEGSGKNKGGKVEAAGPYPPMGPKDALIAGAASLGILSYAYWTVKYTLLKTAFESVTGAFKELWKGFTKVVPMGGGGKKK